jgi:hypothetical protein
MLYPALFDDKIQIPDIPQSNHVRIHEHDSFFIAEFFIYGVVGRSFIYLWKMNARHTR